MTPLEFTLRFAATIPQGIPTELRAELAEFAPFDAARAAELGLAEVDVELLTEAGLPRNCAPFLRFGPATVDALAPHPKFPAIVAIGSTGFGDPIGLDLDAHGAVVLLDRDSEERTRLNSSVVALAHCLCAMAELRTSGDTQAFVAEISTIDPAAAVEGSWWMREVASRRR